MHGSCARLHAQVASINDLSVNPRANEYPMPSDRLYIKSSYHRVLELSDTVLACGHPFRDGAVPITREYLQFLDSFATPSTLQDTLERFPDRDPAAVAEAIEFLVANGFLIDLVAGDEVSQIRVQLGRSMLVAADAKGVKERVPLYQVKTPPHLRSPAPITVKVLFYGRCNVQVGMDILRDMAAEVGLKVEARSSFFDDIAFVGEWKPDFVVIGFLSERHDVLAYPARTMSKGDAPPERYQERLQLMVDEVRAQTAVPLLILNFPTPTCSPLGIADQGVDSHVNKARRINLGIAAVVGATRNAYVVDIASAWGLSGKRFLLDDTFESFSHLGSLSYVRFLGENPPSAFGASVPPVTLMPGGEMDLLAADRLTAESVLLIVRAALGYSRRKCIVVDLDNTLWPGVLAETGSPFPEGQPYDPFAHGLYIGIHSALRALRDRGFLLAVCSKNDEDVVRKLWRIPDALRAYGFLDYDDFVVHRINWDEKAENVVDIAATLNIGLDSVVFIDDAPIERAKVAARLPEVLVLGDNLFTLRWELLTRAEFQTPAVTTESAQRQAMVKGQLLRERGRADGQNHDAFLTSLDLSCEVSRVTTLDSAGRIQELIVRTRQFNTTGRRYAIGEVEGMILSGECTVATMRAKDRFADYGIVGTCLASGDTILVFVISCRVIGLGLEEALLKAVVSRMRKATNDVVALFTPTDRNHPARRLFPSAGFEERTSGVWVLRHDRPLTPTPGHIAVTTLGFDVSPAL